MNNQLIPAVSESLRRTAFFAEAHSIKGLLALDRLSEYFGPFDPDFIEKALNWNQLLQAPKAKGCFSDLVNWPMDTLPDQKLKRLMTGAVFPIAYAAAREWVKRRGFRDLILSFKEIAINRVGYLGHSWTIWCSFLEIEPYLSSSDDQVFAAERFVEFVASELSSPDWTSTFGMAFPLESQTVGESDVVSQVLLKPGFFGHTLITLSYLFKYRESLSADEWKHALYRVFSYSKKVIGDSAHDRTIPKPIENREVGSADLKNVLHVLLDQGPKEVHTLTLADGAAELWKHIQNQDRLYLLAVLKAFAEWKVERTASGERKR